MLENRIILWINPVFAYTSWLFVSAVNQLDVTSRLEHLFY